MVGGYGLRPEPQEFDSPLLHRDAAQKVEHDGVAVNSHPLNGCSTIIH